MKTNKIIILLLSAILLGASCSKDFLNVPVYDTMTADAAAKAAEASPEKVAFFVDAIYNILVNADLANTGSHDAFGYMAILHAADLMSEDIVMNAQNFFIYDYLHDNREWNFNRTSTIWRYFYTAITSANNVLLITSAESTSPLILATRGQALALRAFSYFYLIQLYQHVYPVSASGDRPGVPMYYASNEGKANISGRASVATVLAQIEEDLTTAVDNLKGWNRNSKNQINYSVANGLLARYYLLTEQWDNAAKAAKEARKGLSIMPASSLLDGFMDIGNTEWMWGYDHNPETATFYASFFSHISNLASGYAGLNYAARLIDKRLYESIPDSDLRKQWFQTSPKSITPKVKPSEKAIAWELPYANLKFGDDGAFTMDYLYMRTSEMVLIEAEALAQQGLGAQAATVLKELLSQRDPNWNAGSVTAEEVWHQRRIELWGEGFATFDLKRLHKGIDRNYTGSNHYSAAKFAIPAGDKRWIFQIPQSEILENPDISEADNNEKS
ncbi:MAG: RagB/SusD family nutrient uptake outer membrane protein [Prevotellaceae bacterium]|jgi:hypothetical protein|nr:RagB/SusD family nutrient uptake outer membrane protein [Prevotellaceae bacterium]